MILEMGGAASSSQPKEQRTDRSRKNLPQGGVVVAESRFCCESCLSIVQLVQFLKERLEQSKKNLGPLAKGITTSNLS